MNPKCLTSLALLVVAMVSFFRVIEAGAVPGQDADSWGRAQPRSSIHLAQSGGPNLPPAVPGQPQSKGGQTEKPEEIIRRLAPPASSSAKTGETPGASASSGKPPGASAELPLTEGYEIPLLISLLHDGAFARIPNDGITRRYYGGFLSTSNELCGEGGGEVGLAAIPYVLLSGIGTLQEGVEDARLFYSQFHCQSTQARKLRRNLHTFIIERSGTPATSRDDPKFQALRRGQIPPSREATDASLRSCLAQYENRKFCECMSEKMQAMKLSDAHWEKVSKNFMAVATVTDHARALLEAVQSCD